VRQPSESPMNIANSIPRFPGVSFPDFAIAVPPLGSGLGGLHWSRVKVMIEAAFEEMPDVRVRLYEPKGSPERPRICRWAPPNQRLLWPRTNTGG